MYKHSIVLIVLLVALVCTTVSAQSDSSTPANMESEATYRAAITNSDGAIAYHSGVDYGFLTPLDKGDDYTNSGRYTFALKPNVPNPFNPATRIDYSLAKKSHVKISILDSAKQEIDVLTDEIEPAGNYSVVWYGIDRETYAVEPGTYYCRIEAGDFIQTQKMILRR